MTIEQHIQTRLSALGVQCVVHNDEVHVPRGERTLKIKIDEEWRQAYSQYKRARSLSFDADSRSLQHNNSVEVLVTRLSNTSILGQEQYNLTDQSGNTVNVGTASHTFGFAFFDSTEYEKFFEAIVRKRLTETEIYNRRISQIVWLPNTASYTHKGRKIPQDLKDIALNAIRSSLLKIAVEQHDCLSIWKPRNRRTRNLYLPIEGDQTIIPKATYDDNVSSYYKVAKSSPFPSQSFLAYYHVLEYHFLTVSELLLHDRLTAMLNTPSFIANRASLDKVISAVRGQDSRSDETEMLRNVLDRFVQESELIDFINRFEDLCGEKIYSKKRKIFGEQVQITPIKDHALANAAKFLKHIRNAIVHSSDRYKREDCHIPLSETEDLIEEFIPLIRFFAERVIFGTAT
jgi:hypothetical protein